MKHAAILHPLGILGKELRETMARRRGTWSEVKLLSTRPADAGVLSDAAGHAGFVQPWDAASVEGVDVIFVCGPMAENRPVLDEIQPGTLVVVLALDATVADGRPAVAGLSRLGPDDRRLVSPHPIVVHLAHLLAPLERLGPFRASATTLVPASLTSDAALDEVFDQTRNLLNMRPLERGGAFDRQVAFDVHPVDFAESSLRELLAATLGNQELAITLGALQAGTFHSLGCALHLGFASDPGVEAIVTALDGQAEIELTDAPGVIDCAGRDEILVARPTATGPPGHYWLWSVMDNLTRGGAVNALDLVDLALEPSPVA